MDSPSAILPAISVQVGFTRARQQATAIKVLHLKCLEAVIAISTGRKVKGVQLIISKI